LAAAFERIVNGPPAGLSSRQTDYPAGLARPYLDSGPDLLFLFAPLKGAFWRVLLPHLDSGSGQLFSIGEESGQLL